MKMSMPRKPLIRSKNLPYHVTTRTHNKEWFDLPLPIIWEFALLSLQEAHSIHKVNVISFVLMNNHYHLMLLTPEGNLDTFMYEFNKRLALRIKNKTGRLNQTFGGKYKWCLITSTQYFLNCYRYVYQNPIRAKISKRCEDYIFSTLYSIVNVKLFVVPLHDSLGFKDKCNLNWINSIFKDDELFEIKKKIYQSEY